MLSTLLACLLLWTLYLWLDRRRLIRRTKPTFKPTSTYYRPSTQASTKPKRSAQTQRFFDAMTGQTRPTRAPSKPQFSNSKPISAPQSVEPVKEIPQSPPLIEPALPQSPPSIEPISLPRQIEPVPSQPIRAVELTPPQPEIDFAALQREAAKRQQELCRVKPNTQHELYRLCGGDVKMLERLVSHSRSRYPNQSEQWVWEKVIHDLERDRGYR